MVFVSFIWHMHQPYYKNDTEGKYAASWVRLHASKDYLDMLKIAQNNQANVTFNLTPVLVNQIFSYKSLEIESASSLLLKTVVELTNEQKQFIIEDSFKIDPNIIQKNPVYKQLYKKKQNTHTTIHLTDFEILQAQVLYLISWFGNLQKDTEITKIENNIQFVTHEDKLFLLEKQLKILQSIIPLYKDAFLKKEIDITTTPFYHPILPLLIDTDIARISNPSIKLPLRFSFKEDALWHIKTAKQYMEQTFENKIVGMWPSEGSVSDEALKLIAQNGFAFAATDEQIIQNSIPNLSNIYKPFLYENNDIGLYMFFRDHTLSDKIGFVYSHMNYKDAVSNFINSLKNIESIFGSKSIVSIILDGENAWEYYENNGYNFLNTLYDQLNKSPDIELITHRDYLDLKLSKELKFDKVWPGSWIGANFNIWIGDDEDNTAWDLLLRARNELSHNKASLQELYKAQGSDWNWWYGHDHSSSDDYMFDNLFRSILIKAYKLAKKTPPRELFLPIKKAISLLETKTPMSFINPNIDGKLTSFYEWSGAGEFVEIETVMSVSEKNIKKLFYGFDGNNIFIRMDFNDSLIENNHNYASLLDDFQFIIEIFDNVRTRVCIKKSASCVEKLDRNGKTIDKRDFADFAIDKILELKISKEYLGVKEKEKVYIHVVITKGDSLIERFPANKDIYVEIPSKNFEYENWIV